MWKMNVFKINQVLRFTVVFRPTEVELGYTIMKSIELLVSL
jgi:hypothetical protein